MLRKTNTYLTTFCMELYNFHEEIKEGLIRKLKWLTLRETWVKAVSL